MVDDARFRDPAAVRLVFDGQSMLLLPGPPRDVPQMVSTQLGIPWVNVCVGGNGWYDRAAVYNDPATGLAHQSRPTAGTIDCLVMFGGQGDVLNASPSGQQTGATCYSRAVSYAAAARASGFDYVVGVTWPHLGPNVAGLGRPTPSELEAWEDAVDLYYADASNAFDAVVDCHSAPLNDATNLTYFLVDRLHLTQAGGQVCADRIAPVVASVLGL